MLGKIVEAQRFGLGDQQTEQSVPGGQVSDQVAGVFVDALGDELLQSVAVAVEHTEGSVAAIGQFDRRVHDPFQRRFQLQPGRNGEHCLEQGVDLVPGCRHLVDAILNLCRQLSQPELGQAAPEHGFFVTCHTCAPFI
ncbi:MAG: hypothetical protein WAW17_19600 [Rhodococcus sp. (in: high G+C Gram-positive bacteria)]